jgi:hypothetical protein
MIKTLYLVEIIKHHQNNMPISSESRCFYAIVSLKSFIDLSIDNNYAPDSETSL